MSIAEIPLGFECAGERLLGIVAHPLESGRTAKLGVVVVVGGPQYRIGSHRQFLLLARRAAEAGFATLRFDYRGMGDSDGAPRSFEDIDEDIDAAIGALCGVCPQVEKVALWGLCDGASAALLYCQRRHDPRVAALCLLNPWARSETTLARARVRHYYPGRLLERDFWANLVRGRARLGSALAELLRNWRLARTVAPTGDQALRFRAGMAAGMRGFAGPILMVLSGRDATAQEFLECARTDAEWAGVLGSPHLTRFDLPEADHTFSDALSRGAVDGATVEWLRSQTNSRS